MSEAPSQWVSVGEAAAACAVSERTLWRWCRDGVVESRQEKRGQQNTRLVNPESLPDAVSEAVSAPASEGVGGRPDMAAVGVGCQGLNGASQEVSPLTSRLTAAESEVQFLRDQLNLRSHAEQELRVMLARLERTNSELAGALVQKALPPAGEIGSTMEPIRKVRWWWPWAR